MKGLDKVHEINNEPLSHEREPNATRVVEIFYDILKKH